MSKLPRFRVVFEEEAGEFIVAQSKGRRRRLMDICYTIAGRPFSTADFDLLDADGRMISHVSTEGYLVSYTNVL